VKQCSLRRTHASRYGDEGLQSWVPACTDGNTQTLRPLQVGASHADGESPAVAVHVSPRHLHVHGLLHGSIAAMSGVIESSTNWEDIVRAICECWSIDVSPVRSVKRITTGDDFVWSITIGRLRNRWPEVPDHPILNKSKISWNVSKRVVSRPCNKGTEFGSVSLSTEYVVYELRVPEKEIWLYAIPARNLAISLLYFCVTTTLCFSDRPRIRDTTF
jgi:hypothetical protein